MGTFFGLPSPSEEPVGTLLGLPPPSEGPVGTLLVLPVPSEGTVGRSLDLTEFVVAVASDIGVSRSALTAELRALIES